jgi:hypothetical protein
MLTASQRAALQHASRPPGKPAMWHAVGTAVRQLGRALDAFGASIQAEDATVEKRVFCSAQAPAGQLCFPRR